MFKYLRQLIGGNILLKITSFNSIAIGVRIVAGLITSKVVAFYLGAQGMALLGDLRNFLASAQSVSTLGIYNGVVKYIAEFKEVRKEMKKILSTAYYLGFFASILTGAVLYWGASYWNALVFKEAYDFTYIFEIMALLLPLYALNMFCLAIINGFGKYKSIILLNVISNVLGLLITVFLIVKYNMDGAFIAVILIPALTLLITFVYLMYRRSFVRQIKSTKISWKYVKRFASYTGMTLFSAMVSPWIYIGIRQHIIDTDGIMNAGYWDAMLRLSDYYLMFVTTILSIYILPRLSEGTNSKAFRTEIFNFYRTILPLFGLGLIVVYLLKNILVRIVFTEDFLAMEPIFKWQLAGDFIRVASLVLGYQFIAKNMFWHFVITQLISLVIIYYTSLYFVDLFGFVGASMGHLISYLIYFAMLLAIFRKPLFYELTD